MRTARIDRCIGVWTACLMAACATATPAGPLPENADHRQAHIAKAQALFPRAQYLIGFGAGATAQAAESDAQIQAAASIRSEIQANLQSMQSQHDSGGKTTSGMNVSEEVVQKVSSDVGEFIHVHPELTELDGGTYEAVAVISRLEMDGKYARDAQELLAKVMVAWDAAQQQQAGPIQAVAASLCEARRYEARLDSLDRDRWLVAGHGAWTPESKERRQKIEELRSRLKSTKVSIVRTPEVPGMDEALSKAIGKSGFPAEIVGNPNCAAGGLVVVAAKAENCGNSMLGLRCETTLTATGNRCNDNEALFSESSNVGIGMNSSDQAIAQRAAMKKIDIAKFVESVSGRIASSLEGECGK